MDKNMAPIVPPEVTLESVAFLLTHLLDLMRQNMPDNAGYYDNADMKRLFHFSDSTLYRYRKSNILPFKKIQGKFIYPKAYFHPDLL